MVSSFLMLAVCAGLVSSATQDAWIDLSAGWRFQPDPGNAGVTEGWHQPLYKDSSWRILEAGKRWEDQGLEDLDGYAWYRHHVEAPRAWRGKPVWLVLGGVNDACAVYCNGQLINTYGDKTKISVCMAPLIADLTPALRLGEHNLVAIQCYDWGASGGLWRLPCALTTDAQRLPMDSLLACHAECKEKGLSVEVDLTGLGNSVTDKVVRVAVANTASRRSPVRRTATLAPGQVDVTVAFDMADAEPGNVYRVTACLADHADKPFAGIVASTDFTWPERPGWTGRYSQLKVLNNFVTELVSIPLNGGATGNHPFLNPRNGWVFIRVTGEEPGKTPCASLAGASEPLVWRVNPDTGAYEAMQFLAAGEHWLQVKPAVTARLEIRTMPEIAFCYYPSSRHIEAYPPYDWAYVNRHILPHVNTLVTRSDVAPDEFNQWLREGRRWVSNASLPGLSAKEAPTADDIYAVWEQNPGVQAPGFAGMIVDEFLWAGAGHYQAWRDAVLRLDEHPAFRDRTFYAWCGDLSRHQPSQEFSRMLMEHGHRFAWEVYLREEPAPEKARRRLVQHMGRPFEKWKQAMPGIERHMVMCLGYLSAPPESLNLDPSVDYQVYLDMQFHFLANDPAFWGLYGVMEYMAAYADEESIRVAHKLFRHYCIEGNSTRFSEDPYLLPHIQNPDFATGLKHWETEPAEKGSIDSRHMEGFSWLQGRYPKTDEGDHFCWMKRSTQGPNRVHQTVTALEPGRLYSVKLISADLQQLDTPQKLGLHVRVEGAEGLAPYAFQHPYPSCYSHEHGPYTREHPAWFNFHRFVFRATSDTATLSITDWAAPDNPGDPPGQELAFNFVEVQPFRQP